MIFVTGTDTGVGKTHFVSSLIRQFRANEISAVGFKPICCGDRDDAEKLTAASDASLALNECNPIWMRFPASPYTASIIEEKIIDLDLVREQFDQLRRRFPVVVVEGAGGWSVPIRRDFSMAHLAREFSLPVLLVAANRLGVLNHTLLTVQAIQACGLTCAGVVLNNISGVEDPVASTNGSILEDLLASLDVAFLGETNHASTELPSAIYTKITSLISPKKDLPLARK